MAAPYYPCRPAMAPISSSPMETSKLLEAASIEHNLIDSLCTFDEFKSSSISCDTVMILSEKLSPSYILGSGGVLFESFILRRCSVKDHNMFMTLVRQKMNSGLQIFVNEEFKNKLVSKFSIPFWYHVIQCCASIHQRNNNKPLEQLTLNLEYRGLSRFGIEIMAACGAATPPRTHDRKRNESLIKYRK